MSSSEYSLLTSKIDINVQAFGVNNARVHLRSRPTVYLQAEEQRQALGKEKDAAAALRHLLEDKEARLKQVEGDASAVERRLKEATDELGR